MIFHSDVEITIQADIRSTAAAGRAFILDKSANKLVEKSSTNVTFRRGGEIPFENTVFISIDVSDVKNLDNLQIKIYK